MFPVWWLDPLFERYCLIWFSMTSGSKSGCVHEDLSKHNKRKVVHLNGVGFKTDTLLSEIRKYDTSVLDTLLEQNDLDAANF